MRVKGLRNAHLVIESGTPSLTDADRDARSITDWLIMNLNSRTIYFLWEKMKDANLRYGLEAVMQSQRRDLDAQQALERNRDSIIPEPSPFGEGVASATPLPNRRTGGGRQT